MSRRRQVRFRTDLEKAVLVDNFERRGWVSSSGDDWNFYWANIHSIKALFNPETGFRLADNQIINHYPNHYELTRKDLMAKNVKRYIKEATRNGLASSLAADEAAFNSGNNNNNNNNNSNSNNNNNNNASGKNTGYAGSMGGGGPLDFLPSTYALPQDYGVFVEEFRRHPQNTTWIMKPSGKSQGSGIFLVDKLSQVKKWAKDTRGYGQGSDSYVISRYIERPLLVGGKKFDLRMYVLVTSWRPLMAYRYKLGFARFCAVKYSPGDLQNNFVHLTNVAVQKKGRDYDAINGGKWTLPSFWLYIESTRGRQARLKLEHAIDMVFTLSLKACQGSISNDPHAFEIYGYDIIIDEDLKPWLIEVNASPSLSATTDLDRVLKTELIRDTLEIVIPRDFPNSGKDSNVDSDHHTYHTSSSARDGSARSGGGGYLGSRSGTTGVNVYPREDTEMGNYVVLYDESAEIEAERAKRDADVAHRFGPPPSASRRRR